MRDEPIKIIQTHVDRVVFCGAKLQIVYIQRKAYVGPKMVVVLVH